jgi:hypothetical protein
MSQQPGIWRKLHASMLATLEDGSFMRFSGYSVAGRTFTFRNLKEFWQVLREIEALANMEEGLPPYRGRGYAGQGGRG